MNVKITGHVQDKEKVLSGIVNLPEDRALRLIRLGAAEPVDKTVPIGIGETGDSVNPLDAMEQAKKVMADQSATIERLNKENEDLKDVNRKLTEERDSLSKENVSLQEKLKVGSETPKNESKGKSQKQLAAKK